MKRAVFENLPGQLDLEDALLEEMFERHEEQADEYFHWNEPHESGVLLDLDDDPIDDEDEGDTDAYYDAQNELSEELGIADVSARISREGRALFERAAQANSPKWEDLDDSMREEWMTLASVPR